MKTPAYWILNVEIFTDMAFQECWIATATELLTEHSEVRAACSHPGMQSVIRLRSAGKNNEHCHRASWGVTPTNIFPHRQCGYLNSNRQGKVTFAPKDNGWQLCVFQTNLGLNKAIINGKGQRWALPKRQKLRVSDTISKIYNLYQSDEARM